MALPEGGCCRARRPISSGFAHSGAASYLLPRAIHTGIARGGCIAARGCRCIDVRRSGAVRTASAGRNFRASRGQRDSVPYDCLRYCWTHHHMSRVCRRYQRRYGRARCGSEPPVSAASAQLSLARLFAGRDYRSVGAGPQPWLPARTCGARCTHRSSCRGDIRQDIHQPRPF